MGETWQKNWPTKWSRKPSEKHKKPGLLQEYLNRDLEKLNDGQMWQYYEKVSKGRLKPTPMSGRMSSA